MGLKINILLFALLLLAFSNVSAQLTSNHKVVSYSPKEYKGHNQTWQSLQDDNGVMYFASGDGVLQFDGVEWKMNLTFTHTNVLAIGMDTTERLYYGGTGEIGYFERNGLGEMMPIQILVDSYVEDLDSEFFWNVHVLDDKVLFISDHFIVVYKNEIATVIPLSNFKSRNSFFLEDYLWLQDGTQVMYKIHRDSLKDQLSVNNRTPFAIWEDGNISIQGITRLSDDKLLFAGTSEKLSVYNELSHSFDHFESDLDRLSDLNIDHMQALPNGELVITSNNYGVVILNEFGKITSVYNETNGLLSNSVRSVFLDREGLLWLTSDVGIYKILANKNYTLLSEQYKEIGGVSNSIIEYQNKLVVGTNEGVFFIKNVDGELKTVQLKDFDEQVFDLIEFDNEVLCATTTGLYVVTENSSVRLDNNYARALVKMSDNFLIVGGRKLMSVFKKTNNSWDVVKSEEFPDEFLHLEKDPSKKDVFWGGLYSAGIARVVVDTSLLTITYKHLNPKYGDHDGYILPFVINDRMIFAPKIEGLLSYNEKDNSFEDDAFAKSLMNIDFSSWLIKEDLFGNLFFEASGPIYVFRKTQEGYDMDKESLSNLNVGYINDIFCSEYGYTWLVAEEGIVKFNPNVRNENKVNSSVILKRIKINADSLLFNGYLKKKDSLNKQLLTLDYDNNNISFEFITAAYSDEGGISYSYKLEGNDTEFSAWSPDRKAIYTNLKEGEYTFIVKSKNVSGVESVEVHYAFEILPPWYRTWYAYLGYAILGIVLIIVVVMLYSLRLKKSNEKLKNLIIEKTKEISFNLLEISEQKDQLEERNNDIIDSINYAKRLQNAILPSNELINKHFKNNFVIYLPKDIVAGDFYWLKEIESKVLIAVADCTGHGVPGAMVSVVCNDALNSAVNEFKITQPELILDKVNLIVQNRFNSDKEEDSYDDIRDGMDVALSQIDTIKKSVEFCGANNPLWILTRENYSSIEKIVGEKDGLRIYEIPANRRPIGSYIKSGKFEGASIQLSEGDIVYMFSDGLIDQFGGVEYGKIKKFKKRNLSNLLISIADESMDQQQLKIKEVFYSWKGDEEQLDDVTFMGIKL